MEDKRAKNDDDDLTVLPPKKRGRPLLLKADLDQKLQLYITARIVLAAARGIVSAFDQSSLTDHGGHIQLNRHWAYSLLNRMKFVKRKVTTANSKYSNVDFVKLKRQFLEDVVTTVEMDKIPAEMILNWDQTAVKIVPSSILRGLWSERVQSELMLLEQTTSVQAPCSITSTISFCHMLSMLEMATVKTHQL